MTLYPLEDYTYDNSLEPEVSLERLIALHKYQLMKAYVIIKPMTIDEHNKLIDATNDIVDKFKENISAFSKLPDPETKWQWVGRIKAEEDIILEKSMSIVNKLHPA